MSPYFLTNGIGDDPCHDGPDEADTQDDDDLMALGAMLGNEGLEALDFSSFILLSRQRELFAVGGGRVLSAELEGMGGSLKKFYVLEKGGPIILFLYPVDRAMRFRIGAVAGKIGGHCVELVLKAIHFTASSRNSFVYRPFGILSIFTPPSWLLT